MLTNDEAHWSTFHCTTNKIWPKQGVWNLMAVLIWLLCWLEQIDCFSEIMALSLGARKTGQMVLYQAPCSTLCPADTFFCWIYMLPSNYCLLESFSQGALFGFVNTIWAVLWNVVQNQPFLISHHRLFNKGSNYDCSHVCWYVKTLPTSPASESERDLMEPRMDIKRWLAGAESVTSRDSTMAAASPPQLLTSFTLTHSAVRSPPSHSPAGREVTKTFQMNLKHCLTVCYCRLFSLWDRVTWLPNGQFGIRSTFLKWSTAPKERHWSTRTHKWGHFAGPPICGSEERPHNINLWLIESLVGLLGLIKYISVQEHNTKWNSGERK